MCCLRYEHEFYVQQRKRFPKEGRLVRTGRGEEKVIANDIFRERVTLRGSDGETRLVPLEELRAEINASGASPLGIAAAPEEMEPVESRVEVDEEIDLEATEVVEGEAPTSEPEPPADDAAPGATAGSSEAERKPHRRRGRRGGRRNRAGRERGDQGTSGDGSAPSSA